MADTISSEEREKSLYLMQIQYLDGQLERCQLQCDELEQQKKHLVSLHSVLEQDKEDVIEYLKRCLDAEEKKVEELSEQLENQQQVPDSETEAMKLQHSQQLQELQDEIDELTSGNTTLAATLKEQQVLEEKLMVRAVQSDMESLRSQLVSQKEEHQAVVNSLMGEAQMEWKNMLEERWSIEGNDIVKTKASSIIQEEKAQSSKLQEEDHVLLNEEDSISLWEQDDDLKCRAEPVCFEVEALKKEIDQITCRNFTYGKETEQLMKKCQQLRVKLKHCCTTRDKMLVEREALSQRLTAASEELCERTAEVEQLREELQRENSRWRQLEAAMQEAAITLSRILKDPQETSENQETLTRLLEVLQNTVHQEPGSIPEESGPGEEPQTTGPRPAREQTLNLAADPLFLLARYIPGDLGFVPRPKKKQKPSVSRTRGQATQQSPQV